MTAIAVVAVVVYLAMRDRGVRTRPRRPQRHIVMKASSEVVSSFRTLDATSARLFILVFAAAVAVGWGVRSLAAVKGGT